MTAVEGLIARRRRQARNATAVPWICGSVLFASALLFGLPDPGLAGGPERETVLLVHGLWGGADSWAGYAEHLRDAGWQEGCLIEFPASSLQPRMVPPDRYSGNLTGSSAWLPDSICRSTTGGPRTVFRVVFRDNDGQTFRMQGRQIAEAVRIAGQLTGDSEVSLVCHSMGGLAARAYLQSPEYRGDVEALITVATPHLGSLLPFLAEQDLPVCTFLARTFAGKNLEAPAVGLLAPDSNEMIALNAPGSPYSGLPPDLRYANIIGHFESNGRSSCTWRVKEWIARWQWALKGHFDPTAANALVSPEVFANWSDGVVPVASQYLKSSPVGYHLDVAAETVPGFHSDLPDQEDVWNLIDAWLARPPGNDPDPCGEVNLALLVDSSGSMAQNDPANLRKDAVSLLIDRAGDGAVFSLVDFDDSASVLVERSSDRGRLSKAALHIDSSGGTNIESALTAGLSALQVGSSRRAAVLFTDGQSSQRRGVGAFRGQGIPIHVVGLGTGVDSSFLQDVATSTGGVYLHAQRASDLAGAFDIIVGELGCEGTVFSAGGTIHPREQVVHEFIVDAAIRRLTATVTWPGSSVDAELVDPGGAAFGSEIASGPTYRIIGGDDPPAGRWRARIVGTDVPPSGEPYRLRVGGPSELRVTAAPSSRADGLLEINLESSNQDAVVLRSWSRIRRHDADPVDGPDPTPAGGGRWRLSIPDRRSDVVTVTAGFEGTLRGGGPWMREVTRTLAFGEGPAPYWRGTVLARSGIHVEIDRGSLHGVRPGAKVDLSAGGEPVAIGIVQTVEEASCTAKLTQRLGPDLPEAGDSATFDKESLGESFHDGPG